MLKFLHDKLDWSSIEIVGFDLDGTLYDEYEFISQVYRPISISLAEATGRQIDEIYDRLLRRWIEKGSSYNRIFDEFLIEEGVTDIERMKLVAQCLSLYRNFEPKLCLTTRVENILDWLSARFPLFLVTDGGEKLQQAKVDALGLKRWIDRDNTSISGYLGQGITKPDVRMGLPLQIIQDSKVQPCKVVYFGDREVDAAFAENCGFQFVLVKVMIPVSQGGNRA